MSKWKEPSPLDLRIRLAREMNWKPHYCSVTRRWDGVSKSAKASLQGRGYSEPFHPDVDRNHLTLVLRELRKRKLFGQWRMAVQCYVEEREFSDDWYEKHGPALFFMVAGDLRVLATLALKVLEESTAAREAQAATGFEVAL